MRLVKLLILSITLAVATTPGSATTDPGALGRERITAAHERLSVLLAATSRDVPALAKAYGELALVQHAFGQLEPALEAITKATNLSPDDPQWFAGRARIESDLGQRAEAVVSLEQALTLNPKDHASRIRLADLLAEANRLDDAAVAYALVESADPDSAAAVFGLARVAIARGDDTRGAALLERALALAPEATALHYPLAQARRRLGDLETAKVHLASAGGVGIEIADPWYHQLAVERAGSPADRLRAEIGAGLDPRVLFSRASRGLGPTPGDEQNLATVLDAGGLEPQLAARFAHALAGLAVSRADAATATRRLEQALSLDPKLADAHLRIANARAAEGDFERARQSYQRTLTLDPTADEALFKLAKIELLARKPEVAQPLLERLATAHPHHVEGRLLLGETREASGQADAARADYEALLTLDLGKSELATVHHHLMRWFLRANQVDIALEHGQKALTANNNDVAVLTEMAALLVGRGRPEQAAPLYERLVQLQPNNPTPRAPYGAALIFAGREVEARDVLERAHAVFPDDPKVLDLFARLLAASEDPAVRDGGRATILARRALEREPTAARMQTYAMALAAAGDFRRAGEVQAQLIDQLERQGGTTPGALADLRQQLLRYQTAATP